MTGAPSKYSFAAHMGQLVRGLEGTGCHNFYFFHINVRYYFYFSIIQLSYND